MILRWGGLEAVRRTRPQGLDGSAESILGSGIFPFGQHAAPGVAVRHKPGVAFRSASLRPERISRERSGRPRSAGRSLAFADRRI